MPFIPELFSAPVLERMRERRRAPITEVPDVVAASALDADGTLELCAVTDDGRACAVEYNVGTPPGAGIAVFLRGTPTARIYDHLQRSSP